jgi:3'-phosphoadenosine 5'-phosphosulfate (PAPS) 3'-phosphatase
MTDAAAAQVVALLKRVDREILAPRHGCVSVGDVHSKADVSWVTPYDRASEQALSIGLKAITPGADVVGEEEIDSDPRAFARINAAGRIWIIDPLDGTGAFTRGENPYGLMAALVEFGLTSRGFIYIPGTDQQRAEQGTNGRGDRRRHQQGRRLLRKRESSAAQWSPSPVASRSHLVPMSQSASAARTNSRLGSPPGYLARTNAAYNYASLLLEASDAVFYSEGFSPSGAGRCPPWDRAAGVLSVQEAGGFAVLPYRLGGITYAPMHRYHQLLIASSYDFWSRIYEHVRTLAPALCTSPAQKDLELQKPS